MTRKRQVDENIIKLDADDNESNEYKMEAIQNSTVYTKESVSQLSRLYYLVFWKSYLKEKNP